MYLSIISPQEKDAPTLASFPRLFSFVSSYIWEDCDLHRCTTADVTQINIFTFSQCNLFNLETITSRGDACHSPPSRINNLELLSGAITERLEDSIMA